MELKSQASFAFVLFYYAEKTGSFAMTGRDGTALRSLAALTQSISVLSGATYIGDLPNSGWRVFNTTADGLVAVVNTGRPTSPNATVHPFSSVFVPSLSVTNDRTVSDQNATTGGTGG